MFWWMPRVRCLWPASLIFGPGCIFCVTRMTTRMFYWTVFLFTKKIQAKEEAFTRNQPCAQLHGPSATYALNVSRKDANKNNQRRPFPSFQTSWVRRVERVLVIAAKWASCKILMIGSTNEKGSAGATQAFPPLSFCTVFSFALAIVRIFVADLSKTERKYFETVRYCFECIQLLSF